MTRERGDGEGSECDASLADASFGVHLVTSLTKTFERSTRLWGRLKMSSIEKIFDVFSAHVCFEVFVSGLTKRNIPLSDIKSNGYRMHI